MLRIFQWPGILENSFSSCQFHATNVVFANSLKNFMWVKFSVLKCTEPVSVEPVLCQIHALSQWLYKPQIWMLILALQNLQYTVLSAACMHTGYFWRHSQCHNWTELILNINCSAFSAFQQCQWSLTNIYSDVIGDGIGMVGWLTVLSTQKEVCSTMIGNKYKYSTQCRLPCLVSQ